GPTDLLQVFANPAPITIAALFILSAALERTGAIDLLAEALTRFTRLGYAGFVAVMILVVGTLSAFINNTPVVMVFLPAVLSLSRKLNVPSSKLLIPLSFASIFGGCCTLVGTSTNVLASGILKSRGFEPLGMFELAAIGAPLFIGGLAYLSLFGWKLLPVRETLTAILSEEERREYLAEAYVQEDSGVIGKTPNEAGLSSAKACAYWRSSAMASPS
ncbi:MAG: SLC13 family permease, partial [Verrucomicrobiae bacterium]|nr:SLC13 family permease [Verrucomicrobiae bacterium]